MTTHKLVNPDGTPYLNDLPVTVKQFEEYKAGRNKQFEEINIKLEVLNTMIMTTNQQLDKYANAVDDVRDEVQGWNKRVTQMKNLVKVMWTKRNDY